MRENTENWDTRVWPFLCEAVKNSKEGEKNRQKYCEGPIGTEGVFKLFWREGSNAFHVVFWNGEWSDAPIYYWDEFPEADLLRKQKEAV